MGLMKMVEYTTFNFPLEPQGNSGLKIKPLYKINELDLPKSNTHSFMNIEWQGVQFDYTFKEKLVAFLKRAKLPNVHISYHLLVKNISDKQKQGLLSLDGVCIIDTIQRYIDIFLVEEEKKRKRKGGKK